MRHLYLSLLLALIFPLCSVAQKKASEADLQRWFSQLAAEKLAVVDSVHFTGEDFAKAGGGFVMQRDHGKGWTAGQRITLRGVKPAVAQKVYATMKNFGGARFHTHTSGTARVLMVLDNNNVYLFDYAPDSTVYFLSANAEDEVCVPFNWRTANYVDASMPALADPFKDRTETELRLLGLARLWAGVKQNFVFYDRLRVDWDSLYAATIPLMAAAKDRTECRDILQRMAAQAGDGHTYVYCTDYEYYTVPLHTKLIDGHVYVDIVAYSKFRERGLKRGDELLSVNGISALDWGRQQVVPLVSSSTPQWTLHQTYDGASLLGGRRGESLRLAFLSHGDTLRIDYTLGTGQWDCYDEEPLMTYRRLKGNVGYLRIRNFYGSDFDEEFKKCFEEIRKTDALIIDVRGNSGGNSMYAEHVLRRLSADTIRLGGWSSPCYIPAYASWSWQQPVHRVPSQMMQSTPQPENTYTKPVAVLVDGGTFSAAEDFVATYVGMKRGHLVGTPTGGSTGNGVRIELIPDHSYANICSKHDVAPDGTEFVGIDLKPDVEVEETYDSYFNAKLDAATSRALDLLTGK